MSKKADKKYGIARSRILMPIIVDVTSFAKEDGMEFESAKEIVVEYYKNLAEKIDDMDETNFSWIIENNLALVKELEKE